MTDQRQTRQRTCIGCGKPADKVGFVRFVRTPQGVVVADSTGRAPGRGAYTCADADCFERAWVRRRFAQALRVNITDADHERLREEFDEVMVLRHRNEESDA